MSPLFSKNSPAFYILYAYFVSPTLTMMHLCITKCTYWTPLLLGILFLLLFPVWYSFSPAFPSPHSCFISSFLFFSDFCPYYTITSQTIASTNHIVNTFIFDLFSHRSVNPTCSHMVMLRNSIHPDR